MGDDRPPLPEGFSWKRALWKGLRPALIAGFLAFGAAFVNNVDQADLQGMGIPTVAGMFLLEAGRNYFKNKDR